MNATATPERITLYHRNHAKRQRGKALSHLVPALVLLSSVAAVLGGEPFTWITAAEIAVGAAYVVLLLRELMHLRKHPHHRERVAWLELAAAGILLLEGYHIWHRHHEAELAGAPHKFHVLPWLYVATALVFVVLAFRMSQLDARRFLHLHAKGFSVRLNPFARTTRVRWAEVQAIGPAGPTDVLVTWLGGRQQRISLGRMHNAAELQQQVLAHVAQHHLGAQRQPEQEQA
ncbi:hypothetical protein [Solirubrum puertoriconensis]|uniref:Uncharacterized protein n=1 Tax=Solirubrum puertoriconensis TaxID=1751427 RepID=A0A9X0L529_SOLP1|nr:hypothetical protein [Solirubrum puertoriconensis]KUG08299.1 hypothetical protein ASU33_08990 [Solirubrum puertoriconensis]